MIKECIQSQDSRISMMEYDAIDIQNNPLYTYNTMELVREHWDNVRNNVYI